LVGPLVSMLPETARLANVRTGVELDAAGLRTRIAGRASDLSALGLPRLSRVVVGEADPVDFVVAILACLSAGLTAVGVNPALSADEQTNVIATTGASHWLGALATSVPHPPIGNGDAARPLGLDEPALILMTSGTTGRPKGIVHSLRGLMARLALNTAEIGAATMRESLCVLPVFFGHGLIGNVLTPLFAGARVHVWPTPSVAELPKLARELEARGITFMSSVPSFWRLALRLSPPPARALERVHVGSAPLSLELWQQVAGWAGTEQLYNMFGMTETANWIGGGIPTGETARDGFVGPIWGGRLAVLGEDGAIRASGRGEVLVQSPSLMLGYFERPDLDAEAQLAGWFRTGDTGDLDPQGRLTLVGRLKSEINRGGIKVQAEEIDMLLERHPDIAEACAFGIPRRGGGRRHRAEARRDRGSRGHQGLVPAARARRRGARPAHHPACHSA